MSIRGKVVYISVSVPELRWLKLVMPVFIVTGILDCFIDLLSLGAMVAPNAAVGKKMRMKDARMLMKLLREFFSRLDLACEEDLINVHVGKDDVDVRIRIY